MPLVLLQGDANNANDLKKVRTKSLKRLKQRKNILIEFNEPISRRMIRLQRFLVQYQTDF